MTRPLLMLLPLLIGACAFHPGVTVRYDLDSATVPASADPRLNATLAVTEVQAPPWLRTPALLYRLAYQTPAYPRSYTRSAWAAPPAQLLTLRLRERIGAANDGFTLDRLTADMSGYRLDVTLENFAQVFPSPDQSRCIVTLDAILVQDNDRVLAQKLFRAERPAPTLDAAGAVEGLAAASEADVDQIVAWLSATLPQAGNRRDHQQP